MGKKLRADGSGFTLIELLIVVAIIGIIAAMLVPNLLDALQKAKQKRTMGDMHLAGTAMMSWLTDTYAAGASGQTTIDLADWLGTEDMGEIRSALIPGYIQEIPPRDGWKNTFLYRLNIDDPAAERVMLIGSGGRDGNTPAGSYQVGGFDPTDYDQDLVWTDGRFVRNPQKRD